MRIKALAYSTALGAGLLCGAPAMADGANAAPPAAPMFYCPKPIAAKPAACPAPAAGRHAVRSHRARSHKARQARRSVQVEQYAESAANPEDEGTSASQAWSYRYQLSRGGLRIGEADEMNRGRYESGGEYERYAGGGERYDGEERYGPEERYSGEDDRYAREDDERYEVGNRGGEEDFGRHEERRAQTGGPLWHGEEEEGGYAGEGVHSGDRHHHERHDHHGGYAGGAWGGGYGVSGGVSSRSGSSYSYSSSRNGHARSGGYLRGERDGVPYGWSWGDAPGGRYGGAGGYAGGGYGLEGGYGEGYRILGGSYRTGGGYVSGYGGRYVVGGSGGRRGVWYDTVDQAYPYAGRDEDGYLVWPGKTPR